jgi:hypothetical protein
LAIVFTGKYLTNSNLKDGTKSEGRSGAGNNGLHFQEDLVLHSIKTLAS